MNSTTVGVVLLGFSDCRKSTEFVSPTLMTDQIMASYPLIYVLFRDVKHVTLDMELQASQSRLRLEKEINGKFLREVHRASVKVAESVTQWAEPARNGGWELDCITFSRLMAFAALGTSLYGEEYTSWPVAREFEKVIMEVTEELPTWMPYSVPPIWNAKFNEFRTKCQRLRALKRQLIGNGRQTRPFLEVEDIGGLTEELFSSWFSSMGIELGSVSEPRATGIMSHGSLNTAGVLCTVLIQLALHPHIQTKVR